MARFTFGGKRFYLLVFLVLGIGAGIVWVERKALLSWYYLGKLATANEEDAAAWARRTASLGESVVPDLIEMLGRDDERACANAGTALNCLAQEWGASDPLMPDVVEQMARAFSALSAPGRRVALELTLSWCGSEATCPPSLATAAARLLPAAVRHCADDLPDCSLDVARLSLAGSLSADTICAARDLAHVAFRSKNEQTRLKAVRLATHARLGLRKEVVPFLNDPAPVVRRAAILAIGEDPDTIETDNLLAWLHDPDAEVRQLCAAALQSEKRGLSREHVELARLITHPAWQTRLEVLDYLAQDEKLDTALWLRRLSHDPSPAVRLAAIRAASEGASLDLSDRIDQMARTDPSATVSEAARHYLKVMKEHTGAQVP